MDGRAIPATLALRVAAPFSRRVVPALEMGRISCEHCRGTFAYTRSTVGTNISFGRTAHHGISGAGRRRRLRGSIPTSSARSSGATDKDLPWRGYAVFGAIGSQAECAAARRLVRPEDEWPLGRRDMKKTEMRRGVIRLVTAPAVEAYFAGGSPAAAIAAEHPAWRRTGTAHCVYPAWNQASAMLGGQVATLAMSKPGLSERHKRLALFRRQSTVMGSRRNRRPRHNQAACNARSPGRQLTRIAAALPSPRRRHRRVACRMRSRGGSHDECPDRFACPLARATRVPRRHTSGGNIGSRRRRSAADNRFLTSVRLSRQSDAGRAPLHRRTGGVQEHHHADDVQSALVDNQKRQWSLRGS